MKDSVFRTDKNYYPQVLLEECKYVVKEKKDAWVYYWQQNFFLISENSDEEISSEENSNEENFG